MTNIYQQYQKLARLPAGRFIFSKAIGFTAPFFGKIKPRVVDLRTAYCEVQIKDRWGIRNHIGSINAGALCSLAELTGGMALDSVVPEKMRWIPRGMTVSYLKKARGKLTAISTFDPGSISEGDFIVPIIVRDPPIKYIMPLLELTGVTARRSSKAMAVVLGERFNKAVMPVSSSPTGLSSGSALGVIFSWRD